MSFLLDIIHLQYHQITTVCMYPLNKSFPARFVRFHSSARIAHCQGVLSISLAHQLFALGHYKPFPFFFIKRKVNPASGEVEGKTRTNCSYSCLRFCLFSFLLFFSSKWTFFHIPFFLVLTALSSFFLLFYTPWRQDRLSLLTTF